MLLGRVERLAVSNPCGIPITGKSIRDNKIMFVSWRAGCSNSAELKLPTSGVHLSSRLVLVVLASQVTMNAIK